MGALFHGWRWWLLAAALCALAAPWANVPRDQADSAGMLAHLHALFVDADLLYDDEYAALGMSPLFAFVTDEGVVSNHWPAGASGLQAPGYGLGVASAHLLEAVGIGRAHALGTVAVLGVRAWAMVVLLGVAWACARLVIAGQPDPDSKGARRAGVAVAAAMVGGTPLLYYAAESPLRPHLWGAAVCLALVALWWRRSWGSPWRRTLVLASLAGLATVVRPQLGPLWLLVVHDLWRDPEPSRAKRAGLAAVVFGAWLLLHLRLQSWIYGADLLDYGGSVSHHTAYFLLSTHHGVLPWCPVLLLGAIALGRAAVRREEGAWLLLGLVVLQVWLDGGMRSIEARSVLGTRTWAGGVAFGPRKLVDVLPLLLPAVTALVARLRARGRGGGLLAVAGLLCLPTLLLHASAWLDPDATTGGIMGSAEYWAALRRPFEPHAWATAWAQRSIPLTVTVVVALVVAAPLLGASAWVGQWLLRASATEQPLRVPAGAAVTSLVAAHLWLAVVLVRSDAALEARPQRMVDAARRMTPAHLATVRSIPAHHRRLRERLGEGAAPSPDEDQRQRGQ